MNRPRLDRSVGQIVRQVVALANPQRILLFGSANRGNPRPDSDLDFLVVVDDAAHPNEILDLLNTGAKRTTRPCDFLVATTKTLRRQRDNPGLIYAQILKEGQEVYVQ